MRHAAGRLGPKISHATREVLIAIADVIEKNKEMLAVAESGERQPVRETLAADIPLVVDHFVTSLRCRAEEGRSTEIGQRLVAYHFREPLGVVGQIIRSTSRC